VNGNRPAASLTGLVLFVPAAAICAAWITRNAAIIDLLPHPPAAFMSALSFALLAGALAAEALPARTCRSLQALLGGIVMAVAALALFQHYSGYPAGIDLPGVHAWREDPLAQPGRLAPFTALGLLTAGSAAILMHRTHATWQGVLVQGLTAASAAIGGAGIVGYLLKAHLVYENYLLAGMDAASAAGLFVAAAGLWLAWRRDAWHVNRALMRTEAQRIVVNGTVVLAGIVCAAMLSGFIVMQRQVEALARDSLLLPLKARIDLFRINIDLRSTRAAILPALPDVSGHLRRLRQHPQDAETSASLRKTLESLRPLGFAAVAVFNRHGEEVLRAGRFAREPELAVEIASAHPGTLLWEHGAYVLRHRMAVMDGSETLGEILIEQRLTALATALDYTHDFAVSGQIAVCARRDAQFVCFPQRHMQAPFTIPYSAALPMAHALAGRTGVMTGSDHRARSVIAAHGPIGSLGLGMVLQMDTAELYAPLRREFHLVLMLMLLLTAGGAALLRIRVGPLARRLHLEQERLALALDGSNQALWDWNVKSGKVTLSPRWNRLLGGGAEETRTTIEALAQLVHPDDLPRVKEHLRGILKGSARNYDVEHRVRTINGEWKWIHSRGRVIDRDRNGHALRLIGTNADVSERKEREQALHHRAHHDSLTGLPNRTLFQDRLAQAVARSRRGGVLMAVMLLDVDKFKSVNDELGHDVGDALLAAFAQRLKACARATDTVARLGGDEFTVVLESLARREDGLHIADKIVEAMRPPFELGAHTLRITTSVGIAFYQGEREIGEEGLVKQADEALYAAKAAGRDTFRVAP
jgi:diguanylate cyclase (GGDEF)-like protein/PAS domain S-box-containing protein